jgi:exosortase/archaeosortase family protein
MKNKRIFSKRYKELFFVLFRYILLLLILFFGLDLIYIFIKPLTIKVVFFILNIFYEVSLNENIIIIDKLSYISLVEACIAGSAYLLLLILNLTTPLKRDIRIKSIAYSFILLFVINVIRIVFLSVLYHEQKSYFEFSHAFLWYGLSTIFVIIIWILTIKKFKIKIIPVYTDIVCLKRISFYRNKLLKL